MKRRIGFLVVLLLFFLSGCTEKNGVDTRIQVSLWETEGVTVHNNGQYILPGQDAVFQLTTDSGLFLTVTDYKGEYRMNISQGQTTLTLENVQYPTRVKLELTDRCVLLAYDPNGGEGELITIPYDTTNRQRPNTSIGMNLFSRAGYTLESWNTRPDGSGQRIGLGSRVSVPNESLMLYAQWVPWSDTADFDWEITDETVTITSYRGNDAVVAIPGIIEGKAVTKIAAGAFVDCGMDRVVLPETLVTVEPGAFQNCAMTSLLVFDNIETIGDSSFENCPELRTLYINAVEKPCGINLRRESVYADKVDLLLQAQGEPKIVFYGGCSTWYNLDAASLGPLLDQGYRVINMAINGLVDSTAQMQIIEHFLEPGDIFFHTPELSSGQQMMTAKPMNTEHSDKFWCGAEYNYDLVTLLDWRTLPGLLDGFCDYLSIKDSSTEYSDVYQKDGSIFCDEYGCIPLYRDETKDSLSDEVHMDPSYITDVGLARLKAFYDRYQQRGVRIYVSYACYNMDAVIEEEQGSVDMVHYRFRMAIEKMGGPVLISDIWDFLYQRSDFYDTNYHLLSEPAKKNTQIWLRDLQAQMERDGLWN